MLEELGAALDIGVARGAVGAWGWNNVKPQASRHGQLGLHVVPAPGTRHPDYRQKCKGLISVLNAGAVLRPAGSGARGRSAPAPSPHTAPARRTSPAGSRRRGSSPAPAA